MMRLQEDEVVGHLWPFYDDISHLHIEVAWHTWQELGRSAPDDAVINADALIQGMPAHPLLSRCANDIEVDALWSLEEKAHEDAQVPHIYTSASEAPIVLDLPQLGVDVSNRKRFLRLLKIQ